jgi:hypothetical protein
MWSHVICLFFCWPDATKRLASHVDSALGRRLYGQTVQTYRISESRGAPDLRTWEVPEPTRRAVFPDSFNPEPADISG